jgi:hypothetical protein
LFVKQAMIWRKMELLKAIGWSLTVVNVLTLLAGPAKAQSSASAACAQPCSGGFVCGPGGQCIPACNPPCPAGQVCTPYGYCAWPGYAPAPPGGQWYNSGYARQGYPPSGAPAPVVAVAAEQERSRFTVGPLVGVHSYRGDLDQILGPGLRLGAMGGYRYLSLLSLDAEFTIDVANVDHVLPTEKLSKVTILTVIGPLVHLPVVVGEFVVGPKVGLGFDKVNYENRGAGLVNYTAQAWSVGARGGFFVHTGRRVSVGGMFGFDYTKNVSYLACVTVNGSCNTYAPAAKTLSLAAAAIF